MQTMVSMQIVLILFPAPQAATHPASAEGAQGVLHLRLAWPQEKSLGAGLHGHKACSLGPLRSACCVHC